MSGDLYDSPLSHPQHIGEQTWPNFAHPHFTILNRVPQVMHTLLFWVGGKDSGTGENEEGFHEFFANW